MKENERGFSAVELLLVLVIVGLIGFVGWYVWQTKNKTDKSFDAVSRVSSLTDKAGRSDTHSVQTFNKLLAGWTEYRNDDNGLRLGYPSAWGHLSTVTMSPMSTPDYQDTDKSLQGRLTIEFSKKDGFSVIANKYGATIKPATDNKGWVVAEENPAAIDGYKVGDTYQVKERQISGSAAIDLSYIEEDCTVTRWLVELKGTYATIELPELCSLADDNGNRTPVSASNKDAYSKLVDDFLASVKVY